MSSGWVAGGVRGRGIVRRCLGLDGARELARSPSLAEALAALQPTAYGTFVRPAMSLGPAQHGVSATALWHLRILAGWGPPIGAEAIHVLAAGFEMDNFSARLASFSGASVDPPYELGSLAKAWPAASDAATPGALRRALASSPWGDPGSDELPLVRLALELAWARRLLAVGAARDWAISAAAIVVARALGNGALDMLGPSACRDAADALGQDWRLARTRADLARLAPRILGELFSGIEGVEDLWRAEARWWSRLASDGAALASLPPHDPSSTLGAAALLLADAWRVRAALVIAERGGETAAEVLDELV